MKTFGYAMVILLACAGIFLGSAILWGILEEGWVYSDALPSKHMKTAEEFIKWQNLTGTVERADLRGAVYYMITGPFARSLASGHSAYVFDKKGNLVAWTKDIGDFRNGIIETFYENKFPNITAQDFLNEIGLTLNAAQPPSPCAKPGAAK